MQKNIYHYTNSSGRCFYIHQRTNKNGTACYYLSSKREGNLIPEIPEGYEVWEHPETSGVFLRKKTDCLITKTENEYLHTSMEKLSRVKLFKIDIRKNEIVIYTSEVPDRHSALSDLHFFRPYQAMLRFTLEDKEKRLFSADRWCFSGSIDGWLNLYDCSTLEYLCKKLLPHLGRESFYDLL